MIVITSVAIKAFTRTSSLTNQKQPLAYRGPLSKLARGPAMGQ